MPHNKNIVIHERANGGKHYLEVQRFGMKQSKFVGKRQLSSDEIAMPG